ncbi:MAG: lamin tail domain-containing protein [Verrucomicrobiota bacterium]
MKPLPLFAPLLGLVLGAVFATGVEAQVLINEISAASSDRLLRSHPDGWPRLGWGPGWPELDFDAGDWETGSAPFGFGRDGIATDLGEAMSGRTPSLYLRKTFVLTAEEAETSDPFTLTAQADSGFVAFVNGREIARANLGAPNGFVYHGQSTFSSARSEESLVYESGSSADGVLRAGENVFAVQVQNTIPSQINERDQSVDQSLGFFLQSLNVGTRTLPLGDENWRFRVGHAEPSGGLVDWAQAALPEVDGGFSDWIELHNPGSEEVDLTGWHLTDDPDEPQKWAFPVETRLASGAYLLVLADGRTSWPGDFLHANFRLSADGEFLGLSDESGAWVSRFEDGYPKQDPFHSYGLSAAGDGGYTFFGVPSPGSANGGVELSEKVKKPQFDPPGGFYESAVSLSLHSSTEGAWRQLSACWHLSSGSGAATAESVC